MRLTDEQTNLIIAAIEAGATDYVAAQAAGISARTFRELRQRAEGRHPTRRVTPLLVEFFGRVDEAAARARMKHEIEIAIKDPRHWLANRARSKPGLDGWTEPVPDEPEDQAQIRVLSVPELQEVVSTLVVAGAVRVPPCADRGCVCSHHRDPSSGGGDDVEP
jgi:hypothetical protein